MESIAVYIIYAVINFQDAIITQEFKPIRFKTQEECTAYLELNREPINFSLQEHLKNIDEPLARVLEVNCGDRNAFIWEQT